MMIFSVMLEVIGVIGSAEFGEQSSSNLSVFVL